MNEKFVLICGSPKNIFIGRQKNSSREWLKSVLRVFLLLRIETPKKMYRSGPQGEFHFM